MLFSFSGQKISFYNACFVLQKKLAILSGKIFTTLKFCLFNNVLTYLFSLSNPNIPPLDLLFHIEFVFFFGTEHTKWFRHFVFGGTFVAAKCIYSNLFPASFCIFCRRDIHHISNWHNKRNFNQFWEYNCGFAHFWSLFFCFYLHWETNYLLFFHPNNWNKVFWRFLEGN